MVTVGQILWLLFIVLILSFTAGFIDVWWEQRKQERERDEVREAYDVANHRFQERMDQALRVYDEEIKAAQIQYEREDK